MKVAIVTGATRGIGLGITKKLLNNGYKICAMGTKNVEDYSDFYKIYNKDDIFYFKGDISNKIDREDFINKSYEKFGYINLLVNNAGIAPKKRVDVLKLEENSIDELFNVNTKGMFFITQLVANKMKEDLNIKNKCIINISSISSEVISVDRADYCISKSGISILTKIFAVRLAEYGINVYEIQPGIIKTDMTKLVEDKYNNLLDKGITPIKRWGYPEDIANAVFSLANMNFKYTTGQVIKVDGGYTLQTL